MSEPGESLDPSNPLARPGMMGLLACTAGLAVANLYYNQPLLDEIARDLRVEQAQTATVPAITALGYGLGIALIAPLGDQLERRSMMLAMLAVVATCLAGIAVAPSLTWVCALSLPMAMTCGLAHVILPYVGQLAPPSQRGRLVGQVMSGVLLGILLARTASGAVGDRLGWRAVFWLAAGVALSLAVLLRLALPSSRGNQSMGYGNILRSMAHLFRTQRGLREAAFTGAALFGCFSCLWSTLAFRLKAAPYGMGPTQAGMFGLVGALGALAAPLVGRLADTRGARFVIGAALALCAVSFAILGAFDHSLAGLIAGVILLDLGVQAAMIANQSRLYGLVPGSESRLNAVYMVVYFIGGSIATRLAGYGWAHARWPGVVAVGMACTALGTALHVWYRPK